MKRIIVNFVLLAALSLACSFSGLSSSEEEILTQDEPLPQSEKQCGDGVCDGPENVQTCPEDCTEATPNEDETVLPLDETESGVEETGYGILYHIVEHRITENEMMGVKCYSFSFHHYLDGGYVQPDGSGNEILDVKDYPVSMVTSKKVENYYYISSPVNPIIERNGFELFNWDNEDQTLFASDFTNQHPVEIVKPADGKYPGTLATSPENKYLLYTLTRNAGADQSQTGGFMPNSMNPFLTDSDLIVADQNNGSETTILSGNYNRQLFFRMADFSTDGNTFYTIARDGNSFKFMKISLETGLTEDFRNVFPGFVWDKLNWDDFFPQENDFAHASFSISNDEKRMIAYKNIYTMNPDNICYSEGFHHLWVFNLEENTTEIFKNQPGYVTDSAWKYDSSEFALALAGNNGCYPGYMDARIEKYDRDGKTETNIVNESTSKITNLSWSPDGSVIGYDVYSTDLVGRLKLVDVTTKQVTEIINTDVIGYESRESQPVTLFFSDWVRN